MYQKTMITGRVGAIPVIKQSKVGFYIKAPVVCEFHVNGQDVKQWYQCNVYSMNQQSLQSVIDSGLFGKGAVVNMTGTHYLINTPQFVGMGLSCNQADMKVVLGANYIESLNNKATKPVLNQYAPQSSVQKANEAPKLDTTKQPSDAPKFYEDDIPY
ncbi:hypothetical protein LMH73_015215 [Vibrio splendidus]|nr:hypothetical protein [Vibrio splendidus]MCC4883241.1 hypothetical protein [Vibrio splendidus]